MKMQRLLLALTLVNLTMLAFMLSGMRRAEGPVDGSPDTVLRGRALEIVDAQGRVRASVSVIPAGTSTAGDRYPETVLLRLITERGRPSVKLSATEEASGASFAGPTGTSSTWVQLEAKGKASSLKRRNEDGREQVVRP